MTIIKVEKKSNLIFLYSIFFILCICDLNAQQKNTIISFQYYTHDFGSIKEDGGTVNYEFDFINGGNSPLVIKNVMASCGCTTPDWPKTAIAPRGSGKILVEFNPINKPGPFSKTLTVMANTQNESTILTVMGKVVPKQRRAMDDYPDALGNLRMVSRYMNFGDLTTEKPLIRDYYIYNAGDSVINIDKIVYNNTFMKVKADPMIIKPKAKAKITIEYDALKRNEFGYVHDKLELITNDNLLAIKQIYVASSISKYFPEMTPEEKAKAPRIKFEKTIHDFGNLKQGEKVTTFFYIKNTGGDKLVIYKVKPSCGCTLSDLEKKELLPGESSKLSLTFDTNGKEGIQEKHINLYCNDPNNFNITVSLKATITK